MSKDIHGIALVEIEELDPVNEFLKLGGNSFELIPQRRLNLKQ